LINNKENFLKVLEFGHIDIDSLSLDELNQAFEFLNREMLVIYHFVLNYSDYINSRHYYTAECALTTLEAHLLTDICDYPNSTVTSLAKSWNRSVSATSQTIRKLMQKDLVTRENSKDDAKIFYLIPTEKGIYVSNAHKRYDTLDIIKTMKRLLKTLTIDEIQTMNKGLNAFTELLKKEESK